MVRVVRVGSMGSIGVVWVVMVRMGRILEDIIGSKVGVELVGVLVNRIKRIRYKL